MKHCLLPVLDVCLIFHEVLFLPWNYGMLKWKDNGLLEICNCGHHVKISLVYLSIRPRNVPKKNPEFWGQFLRDTLQKNFISTVYLRYVIATESTKCMTFVWLSQTSCLGNTHTHSVAFAWERMTFEKTRNSFIYFPQYVSDIYIAWLLNKNSLFHTRGEHSSDWPTVRKGEGGKEDRPAPNLLGSKLPQMVVFSPHCQFGLRISRFKYSGPNW